jgi:hypothetical protein
MINDIEDLNMNEIEIYEQENLLARLPELKNKSYNELMDWINNTYPTWTSIKICKLK